MQDTERQRRSFRGIRTGSQLIKKAEAVGIRLRKDFYRIRHMSGKGGETLLNALLIPDIRIYFLKNRDGRPLKGRNQKPSLSH